MDKAIKIKEIFERKIKRWSEDIQYYNDLYLEAEKENRNKSITVYKYEQNKSKMNFYQRQVDELVQELRVYRTVLEIINNVLEDGQS